MWLLYLSRDEPEMAYFGRLLRTRGYFIIFYIGLPTYAAVGALDQLGMMSPLLQLLFAAIPMPTALAASYLFLRDWREAIAERRQR